MNVPALWPNGIGITTGPTSETECSCQPMGCCSVPLWYTDPQRQYLSQKTAMTPVQCSSTAWNVNADVFGAPLRFWGERPCCSCERLVHVEEAGVPIGKVVMYQPCSCGEAVLAEAFDEQGVSRFRRTENTCSPASHRSGDVCCGWFEYNWPIYSATSPQPVHLTYRQHVCACCYPTWVGFRRWPAGVTANDQKLLLAMAHARYWRIQAERNTNGNHGPH